MYQTAQREGQKNSFRLSPDYPKQSEQKFEDKQKADEHWQLEKKNTQQKPCLETVSNKSMGGAGLKQVSLVRKCNVSPTYLQAMSWHD